MRRLAFLLVAIAFLATACGSSPRRQASDPPPTQATSPSPSPLPTEPTFRGRVAEIDAGTRTRMSFSWRPGCPVPIEDLTLLTVDHWGFDGVVHRGELVIHRDEAEAVLQVFETLFEARFPIERIELVDEYGGDDIRSMEANNTSGFNCRKATGSDAWSEHSFGRAVDLNPLQNPYVAGDGTVLPEAGAAYVDRSLMEVGMIHPGDIAVTAFAGIGWFWGGDYRSVKDYQHFSATGR